MAIAFHKKQIFWGARLVGSAAMLGALFWFLPARNILDALPKISISMFVLVLLLFLCCHVGAATKWWFLLGRAVPFSLALQAHLAGLAANLCLPGAVGGDAVRATMVHGTMRDVPRLTVASIVDRIIDLIALATLSGIALLVGGHNAVKSEVLIKALAFILVIAGAMVWGVFYFLPKIWSLPATSVARVFGLKFAMALRELGRKPLFFCQILGFSIAIQAVIVSLSWWLACGVGLDIMATEWAFAWPLAKVISVLPVSLGGVGLRELSLAGLLEPFGVNASLVVAAGLAWQGVLWCAGGIGVSVQILCLRRKQNCRKKLCGIGD